ncbi:MAG: Rnase Y domain-containing protein, partial [Elusimicrobiota bacterium]
MDQSVIILAVAVAGLVIGYLIRLMYGKSQAQSAEQTAERILSDAKLVVENKKKEGMLEVKEAMERSRVEFEKETRERKQEVQNLERRLTQREESVDRKFETLDKKDKDLVAKETNIGIKEQAIAQTEKELVQAKEEQKKVLERLSGMSAEEAKKLLMQSLEDEAKRDMALLSKKLEQETRETADRKSKDILSIAIQKVAAEHTGEITTSSVHIPNDEIKGRVIGREGRNIRAFEQATGVDLIIDDTPETIIISAFDGVRREIARQSLERLISDGRIHPARIEEVVEKTKREMDNKLKEAGEEAALEAGVPGLNQEIIKLLGKLKY